MWFCYKGQYIFDEGGSEVYRKEWTRGGQKEKEQKDGKPE
jgi:hypothetical protein